MAHAEQNGLGENQAAVKDVGKMKICIIGAGGTLYSRSSDSKR